MKPIESTSISYSIDPQLSFRITPYCLDDVSQSLNNVSEGLGDVSQDLDDVSQGLKDVCQDLDFSHERARRPWP